MYRRLLLLATAAAATTSVPACRDSSAECVCTDEFRSYAVTVVDTTGRPVRDVAITRTHVPTGAVLDPTGLGLHLAGVYPIADDGMLDTFSSEGDVVRVAGEKADASFQAEFVFAVPDPCRCHVVRLDGPDTVTIR